MYNSYLIAAILLAAMSCNQPDSLHHDHKDAPIQLNDGKTWAANIETTEGIKAMQEILANAQKMPDAASCQKLKSDLQIEFSQVIQLCTMTGEAHNQLHNYLMPLAEEIDQLDKRSTCQAEVKAINHTLKEYSKYFH